jgi:hypothetical protein
VRDVDAIARRSAAHLRQDARRRQQLAHESQTVLQAELAARLHGGVGQLDALDGGARLHNGGDLGGGVRAQADHGEPLEQVGRNAVRRALVGAAHDRLAAVRGENDDRRQRALERARQKREALDVEHVHLVDEEHARHELGNALLDVLVDRFVDLAAQLVGDLGAAAAQHLVHHRDEVGAALGRGVGHVEVVQRDVLDDLAALVHLALGQRHVGLGLEVELGGVGVAAADALDGARRGLDVDDVAELHALLDERLVDRGVEAQLLAALGGLERDDDVATLLPKPPCTFSVSSGVSSVTSPS